MEAIKPSFVLVSEFSVAIGLVFWGLDPGYSCVRGAWPPSIQILTIEHMLLYVCIPQRLGHGRYNGPVNTDRMYYDFICIYKGLYILSATPIFNSRYYNFVGTVSLSAFLIHSAILF